MRQRWVIYPFLVASYPTVALYAQNANSVSLSQLMWPLALNAAASVLVVWLLRLVLGEPAKAGLLSVVILTFFYTVVLAPKWVDGWMRYLSGFWVVTDVHVWRPLVVGGELAIAAAAAWLILTRLKEPRIWTSYLNVFALILIAIPSSNAAMILAREPAKAAKPPVALFEPTPDADEPPEVRVEPPDALEIASHAGDRPDIYYIILDGYARTDVMADLFGFDNRPFLERLEQRGFYVAPRSTANYCQTPLCLSSSLNTVYLNDLISPASRDKSQLAEWIGDGAVVRTLRRLGYQFVTFATGFDETEHPEADVYLAPSPFLTGFHRMLINGTPLSWVLPEQMYDDYLGMRDRTLFLLDQVPRVATNKQPTFTFAHIVSPHPPFVFGEHGEDVSPHDRYYYLTDGDQFRRYYGDRDQYVEGYRKQATFLSDQVERMIDRILANSPRPPVIILQSDHGSGVGLCTNSLEQTDLHERMSILNAYYLPGPGRDALYPSISPVNSFRVVFNAYFGAGLELLPDRSYYSTWDDPFVFTDVTERVRPAADLRPQIASSPGEALSARDRDHHPGPTGTDGHDLLASQSIIVSSSGMSPRSELDGVGTPGRPRARR